MIVTFDTNILVYASAAGHDAKTARANELIDRGMRAPACLLLLQTLAEFARVTIGKAGIPAANVRAMIEAWRAVLPVHPAAPDDLLAAIEAVRAHRLAFWDAMLWAAARRLGVRYFLSEDMQDGFGLDGVRFLNPFISSNDDLIDEILPAS
ncbi:MAG TPA: PIN domain-containing protein [Xanthobacteraceae bacterium]|nr:PIN domain-containing protein [Xanthobacteraceae bacterium]